MDIKSLFVDQSTIKINIMKVDSKKLTKTLIDQFSLQFPFDDNYVFTGDKIFGYVKMDKKILSKPPRIDKFLGIAERKGKLIKFSFDQILEVSRLNLDSLVFRDDSSKFFSLVKQLETPIQEKFLNEHGHFDKYIIPYELTFKELFTEEALIKIDIILKNAKEFAGELFEHQIYI
ncbi:hypothetical protein [Chryseobacterium sp.]|uniref:hypothetical protein n=1 Tax=Chryseobacterium sp. TaxID=1871047 RepID=UPI000EEE0F05|nr:hypothetical protein [Chryseobacterium sp.]HCA06807.1 hypothetical protein [Chryseobacterium sp.]